MTRPLSAAFVAIICTCSSLAESIPPRGLTYPAGEYLDIYPCTTGPADSFYVAKVHVGSWCQPPYDDHNVHDEAAASMWAHTLLTGTPTLSWTHSITDSVDAAWEDECWFGGFMGGSASLAVTLGAFLNAAPYELNFSIDMTCAGATATYYDCTTYNGEQSCICLNDDPGEVYAWLMAGFTRDSGGSGTDPFKARVPFYAEQPGILWVEPATFVLSTLGNDAAGSTAHLALWARSRSQYDLCWDLYPEGYIIWDSPYVEESMISPPALADSSPGDGMCCLPNPGRYDLHLLFWPNVAMRSANECSLNEESDSKALEGEQCAKARMYFGPVDLDVDSDNSNPLPDYGPDYTADEESLEEVWPGRNVNVNNDDDDGDGILDYGDLSNPYGDLSNPDEDDFVRAACEVPEFVTRASLQSAYSIRFSNPGQIVRLWKKAGNDPTRTADDNIPNNTLLPGDFFGLSPDKTTFDIWIEGLAVDSSCVGPTSVALCITKYSSAIICDNVLLTVMPQGLVDLDIDSNNDGLVDDPAGSDDRIELTWPGKILCPEDGRARMPLHGFCWWNIPWTTTVEVPAFRLTWEPAAAVKVFMGETSTAEFVRDKWYTKTYLSHVLGSTAWFKTNDVWVQGESGGEVQVRAQVLFEIIDDVEPVMFEDVVTVTVLDVDVDVDSDNSGAITTADDDVEAEMPVRICWPLPKSKSGVPQLQEMKLQVGGPDPAENGTTTTITLEIPPCVRVWEDANMSGPPLSAPTMSWTDLDSVPDTLYMEGVAPGTGTLKLTVQTSTGAVCDDEALVQVSGIGPIAFSEQPAKPDGKSAVDASVPLDPSWPSGTVVLWEIRGDKQGCKIESTGSHTARILTGNATGKITVRATLPEEAGGCFTEARLQLLCGECKYGKCEAGAATAGVGSVDVSFKLGPATEGDSAGFLTIYAQRPDYLLATPYALTFNLGRSDIDVIREDGHLRQVLTPAVLADVDYTPGEDGYYLRFFHAEDVGSLNGGLYGVNLDDAFATWYVEREPNDVSRLTISRLADGLVTEQYHYQYTEVGDDWTWTLESGDGTTVLRTETESWSSGGLQRDYERSEDGVVVQRSRVIYAEFDWGTAATQYVVDPDGLNLTSSETFYATGDGAAGRTRLGTNSDGSQRWYAYDEQGRVTQVVSSWLDQEITDPPNPALAQATIFSYSDVSVPEDTPPADPFLPRVITEQVLGETVARTFHAYSYDENLSGARVEVVERCVRPNAVYGDADNLRTVTTYWPGDDDKVWTIERPDGRLDTYDYGHGVYNENPLAPVYYDDVNGAYLRTTVKHGTTLSPAGLDQQTTADVEITDHVGRVLLRETYVYDFDDGSGTGTYDRVSWNSYVREPNGNGRIEHTYGSDGTHTASYYDCCNEGSRIDATGVQTDYGRDVLGRTNTTTKVGTSGGSYPAQADIASTITREAGTVGGNPVLVVTTSTVGGTVTLQHTGKYDVAGRPVESTDEAGLTTTYTYGVTTEGGRVETVTKPDNSTETTEYHRDGRVRRVSGTAVMEQLFDYGVATDGSGKQWTEVTSVSSSDPTKTRRTRTTRDLLGRTVTAARPTYPSGALDVVTTYYYNDLGQLERIDTPDRDADTWYVYDALGSTYRTGLDLGGPAGLEPGGADRIQETTTQYVQIGGNWWRQMTSSVYAADNDPTATPVSVSRERLTGLDTVSPPVGGYVAVSQTVQEDAAGNTTTATTFVNRSEKLVLTVVEHPDSSTPAVAMSLNGLVQTETFKAGTAVSHAYDGIGRRIRTDGPRSGTWVETVFGDGSQAAPSQVWKTRTSGDGTPTTTHTYYQQGQAGAGQLKTVENALGHTSRYSYNQRGQLERIWGDVPQPTSIEYDGFGQRWQLHTYRDAAADWASVDWPTAAAADTTTWIYDSETGLLVRKQYGDPSCTTCGGIDYTYTADGRPATRTWARTVGDGGPRLATTHTYSPNTGELHQATYNDGSAPVTFSYKRFGGLDTVVDATGTHTYGYTDVLQIHSETLTGALYPEPIEVVRIYEPSNPPVQVAGRFAGVAVQEDGNSVYQAAYDYDAAGRLHHVFGPGMPMGDPAISGAWYFYGTDSDLIDRVEFRDTTNNTRAWIDRAYESNRNLVASTQAIWGPHTDPPPAPGDVSSLSMYSYVNDALARRTSVVHQGAAFGGAGNGRLSIWEYDDRNELMLSERHLGTDPANPGALVPAEVFGYDYDPIGNRQTYTAGTQPQIEYTQNRLNQYSRSELPTTPTPIIQSYEYDADGNLIHFWVTGDMNCDGVVNFGDVNAFSLALSNPARYALLYPDCDPMNGDINGDGVADFGDINPFVDMITGDGNAGLSVSYVYDAENRLTEFRPTHPELADPNHPPKQIKLTYDAFGRRVVKEVFDYDPNILPAGDWRPSPTVRHRYIWNDWQLLAETVHQVTQFGDVDRARTYTWGLDLSGTLEGAGGIGGLLAVHEDRTFPYPPYAESLDHAYVHDANGNVVQLVDLAATGPGSAIKAHYEYDPYGGRANAPATGEYEQPFRFSTKLFDEESGLLYFGYRYYNPGLGRWISRDPIGERGGANLYRFVSNRATGVIDPLGLTGSDPTSQPCNICGPDITGPLRTFMSNLKYWFGGLPSKGKNSLCNGIVSGGGWDIDELHNLKVSSPGCGVGDQCSRTVWADGGCWDPTEVNYALWGLLNRMCGRSVTTTTWATEYWKRTGYNHALQRGSRAWMEWGYSAGGEGELPAMPRADATVLTGKHFEYKRLEDHPLGFRAQYTTTDEFGKLSKCSDCARCDDKGGNPILWNGSFSLNLTWSNTFDSTWSFWYIYVRVYMMGYDWSGMPATYSAEDLASPPPYWPS